MDPLLEVGERQRPHEVAELGLERMPPGVFGDRDEHERDHRDHEHGGERARDVERIPQRSRDVGYHREERDAEPDQAPAQRLTTRASSSAAHDAQSDREDPDDEARDPDRGHAPAPTNQSRVARRPSTSGVAGS